MGNGLRWRVSRLYKYLSTSVEQIMQFYYIQNDFHGYCGGSISTGTTLIVRNVLKRDVLVNVNTSINMTLEKYPMKNDALCFTGFYESGFFKRAVPY